MQRVLTLIIGLLFIQTSWALTDDLSLVGKGSMRWLFFELYDAELYSANRRYQHGQYPVALTLTYKKNISCQDLVKTTREEWQRLGLEVADTIDPQLAAIWQDVRPKDQLTFRANSKHNGEFYFNGESIGAINHPNFSEHFLAIWLSTDTRDKTLRANLIGSNNA